MMGQQEDEQRQFFYVFDLDEVVPPDHLVRQIDGLLDLSWVHKELAPYYSPMGRPSIDPVLMIRMLIVGYVFALRSERRLCSEVQVNLAYHWFCKLGVEDSMARPICWVGWSISMASSRMCPCSTSRPARTAPSHVMTSLTTTSETSTSVLAARR